MTTTVIVEDESQSTYPRYCFLAQLYIPQQVGGVPIPGKVGLQAEENNGGTHKLSPSNSTSDRDGGAEMPNYDPVTVDYLCINSFPNSTNLNIHFYYAGDNTYTLKSADKKFSFRKPFYVKDNTGKVKPDPSNCSFFTLKSGGKLLKIEEIKDDTFELVIALGKSELVVGSKTTSKTNSNFYWAPISAESGASGTKFQCKIIERKAFIPDW